MCYLVTVTNPVYEDDFASTYRFFSTLEEAKAYKESIEADGDWFIAVDIYKANRIA